LTSSATAISEASAIVRARAFVRSCGIDSIPVDLQKYLAAANAEVRIGKRLAPGAAGNTMFVGGRHLITINPNDTHERQRFTVLHEIAHIVLDLPSKHSDAHSSDALYSYVRRPPEEVICDTFAAECLLPHEFLRRDLKDAVAVNAPHACAYILSQEGHVRFASYSTPMRESRFWVTPGIAVPAGSVSGRCLAGPHASATGIIPAYLWTSSDEFVDMDLSEEVRVMRTWNQALTLLWLDAGDDVDLKKDRTPVERDENEPLLRELDGILPWPGGKKRR
jgi:Zn-dependent peptidase ImmA (M78 family)